MIDSSYISIIDSLNSSSVSDRQKIIADFEYETFDDNLPLSLPPAFFAELLRNEKDDICKWYEIKALGEWHAKEYADLVLDIIAKPDIAINNTTLHSISAGALGKMGPSVIPMIETMFYQVNTESKIALIDALGETHSTEALPVLVKIIPLASNKELVYVCASCAKCTKTGSDILQQVYQEASPSLRVIIIDALAKYTYNDAFIKSLISEDTDTFKQAIRLKTYNIISFAKRNNINHECLL